MSIVKLSNNGVKNATAFGSITRLSSMIFIKKLTASSSATLSFVDGASGVVLDDTYKEYIFMWKDIHPQTDNISFQLNFRDGGTDYDATKTTTYFRTYHNEDDSGSSLSYRSAEDLAQSTGFQTIADANSNDDDHSHAGYLKLFNPSSTTFVKNFMLESHQSFANNSAHRTFVAGYCNTTNVIDGVQFKMSSGNIDAGDICLYGIA